MPPPPRELDSVVIAPWHFAPRDTAHALRRNDLRAALARDVMRADFGHPRTGFRGTLRAVLAER